jgi:hypothetical protein
MIIVTTAGRQIGISRQIDDLISQSRRQDYAEPRCVRYAQSLGRRLALAAGTYVLPELLEVLTDHLTPGHLAHLTTLWATIAAEMEINEEDYLPDASKRIQAFDNTWGPGAWARCEQAAASAIRIAGYLTRDRLTVEHLRKFGIRKNMADDWLTELYGRRPAADMCRGNTRRRREECADR